MAVHSEHAQAPAAVYVLEMVGVSDRSWSEAAQEAVSRATVSHRHITGVDVVHSTGVVRNGKIVEFHVNVKIAYISEPALIDK